MTSEALNPAAGALVDNPLWGALLGGGSDVLAEIEALATTASVAPYWWHGGDATTTSWTDRLQSLTLTSTGSGVTKDTINSRAALRFSGAAGFAPSAFADVVAQPITFIYVLRVDSLAASCLLSDGSDGTNRINVALASTGAVIVGPTPTVATATGAVSAGSAYIIRAISGSNSAIYINGVQVADGATGAGSLGGASLAQAYSGGSRMVGALGEVLILPGVDDGNADAEQIEALLDQYYAF